MSRTAAVRSIAAVLAAAALGLLGVVATDAVPADLAGQGCCLKR